VLKGGNVTLIPEGGGESFSAEINEDGTYKFERVATGKYKMCVETESRKPLRTYGPKGPMAKQQKNEPPPGANVPEGYKMGQPAAAAQAENARRYTKIPDQYAEPTSTPLSIEIKGSGQTQDIPLT